MGLEDSILGEKQHYYCSSSEDEDGEEDGREGSRHVAEGVAAVDETHSSSIRTGLVAEAVGQRGATVNTGPKGVIKDWQRYKQLEVERREEQEREKLELIKKLSLHCQTSSEEERVKDEDERIEELLDGDDPFLQEYMKRRMEEMMTQMQMNKNKCPTFGNLIKLNSGAEFLDAIDKENKNVTVVCHIFSSNIVGCESLNESLHDLASQYLDVKFCCLEASSAGMSRRFEKSGVPALLVYKSGNLIGNFVRLTDEFGKNFDAEEVEAFLIQHGFLPDQSLVPQIIRKNNSFV